MWAAALAKVQAITRGSNDGRRLHPGGGAAAWTETSADSSEVGYEFDSSRPTNRPTDKVVNTPGLIWGYSETCSFGLMSFGITAADPQVKFECITLDGEVLHDFILNRSALEF